MTDTQGSAGAAARSGGSTTRSGEATPGLHESAHSAAEGGSTPPGPSTVEREEVRNCRAHGLWRVSCERWLVGATLWQSPTHPDHRFWLPYSRRISPPVEEPAP